MEQNLRDLFERALDDEPALPPADPARTAMVQGRRIRRRRSLLVGGSAAVAVVAVVVAVNVVVAPAAPPPRISAAEARMVPADPSCTLPAQGHASDIAIFLADDITASQRSALQADLAADPLVRDLRFESRPEAYAQFKKLWADAPDFAASVSADSLPESFRMTLDKPLAYPTFAAEFQRRPGVVDLVGLACPGAGK